MRGPLLALTLCAVAPACAAEVVVAEIAVDVGHYLGAPGVISAAGVPEFEFNRALALNLRDALQAAGLRVRMIGERGDYADLYARTRAALGADLFVSIHHDSVQARYLSRASEFSGFSLFVSRINRQLAKSLACASAIGAALRGAGFTPSLYHADPVRGENRPFADAVNGVHYFDNLAVAKTAQMPALLVEAGVIVNRQEEARLSDPATRLRIAQAIGAGAQACLARPAG